MDKGDDAADRRLGRSRQHYLLRATDNPIFRGFLILENEGDLNKVTEVRKIKKREKEIGQQIKKSVNSL